MRLTVRLILACLVACLPSQAIDLIINDFSADYSGSPADLVGIDPALGDSLKMAPIGRKQVLSGPFFLTDTTGNNGYNGTTPIVQAVGRDRFKVGYVAFTSVHSRDDDDNMIYPLANIVTRDIVMEEGRVLVQQARKIAGQENVADQFGAGQSPSRSPTYFNFLAEGQNYMAFWGSMDPGAYIRWTNNEVAAGGGDPNTWGKYLFEAAGDPVNVPGYGEFGASMRPGSGGREAALAYEYVIDPGFNHQNEVRWVDLDDYPNSTRKRFPRTPNYGEDFATAMDSAGQTAVLWRENADLYVTVYSGAQVVMTAPLQVETGVHYKDGTVNHYYRPYAIANVYRNKYVIAYTKSGQLQYRFLTISGFDVNVALSGTPTLSVATTITRPLDFARYPSIAVLGNRMAIVYYNRQLVDTDSIKTFVADLNPATLATDSIIPGLTGVFSPEMMSFNAVGSGWYRCCHYYRTPSVALDSGGSMVVAYDNQFWSKVVILANSPVFMPEGSFTSRAIPLSTLPTVLPFDAILDSVEFEAYRLVTRNSAGGPGNADLLLAISADGSFTDPGSGYVPFPVGRRVPLGDLKYRLVLKANAPDNLTYTRADSLILTYNVKPRRPSLDSIRIGTAPQAAYDPLAPYSILPRKDSVRFVVSGVDLDNSPAVKFYLFSGSRILDSSSSTRPSPGRYRSEIAFLPPDSLPNPMDLSIRVKDDSGWLSLPITFRPEFRNRVPDMSLSLVRRLGADSAAVFRPASGARDTLSLTSQRLVVLQVGDTASAVFRLADGNDDSLDVRLLRNGVEVSSRRVAAQAGLVLPLAADTAAPLVDTLVARITDPDTTITLTFLVRPNRLPSLDSLDLAAIRYKDSTLAAGPFDRINSAADSGLKVPSGVPATLKPWVTDRDAAFGDAVTVGWKVLSRPAGCASGDPACLDTAVSRSGDPLVQAFSLPMEYLLVRVTDGTGAFVERRVRLEYPVLDTAGSAAFRAALDSLAGKLDFILGASVSADTVKAELTSTGNIPLQVDSVFTIRDDRKWLSLKINWEAPGTPPRKDSITVLGPTNVNAVTSLKPVTVAPGAKLTVTFRVTSDSLRGDSVLTDTLVLRTNDLANPYIRIPIRMAYNDLPVLRVSHLGGRPGPAGGYNDAGLPDLLPVRSRLVFAFSEPVRFSNVDSTIRVYSYLDSLKNPAGLGTIPGGFSLLRKRSASSRADSVGDTLVFVPAYTRASDSLKVRPRPGAFIHRDILHIAVTNGVTDRAGNALDLRLDKVARPPGSVDTVWSVRVDTGSFRVVSTEPASRQAAWDPDRLIKVRFNRKLGLPPPQGTDAFTDLSFTRLRGDSSRTAKIRSSARLDRLYDFAYVGVEDGDSTLVLKPRPKLAAFDTAVVRLSGGLTDIDGLTLDGNLDGFPSRFYVPADTTDDYSWTFYTREQDFYVFPNPFRHGDPRHREKGTITFKNINSLRGYVSGREVSLRIHSMNGDLVYSSRSASRPEANVRGWASMEWDLRNNAGNKAGTGVYIYSLIQGGSKVLSKGKVAVIR